MAYIGCPNRVQAPVVGSIAAVGIALRNARPLGRTSVPPQSHPPWSSACHCTAWRGRRCTGHPSRSWAPGLQRARERCIALHIRHRGRHVHPPGHRLWSSDRLRKDWPGRQSNGHPNRRLQVATATRSRPTWRGSAGPGRAARHVEAPSTLLNDAALRAKTPTATHHLHTHVMSHSPMQ